MKKIILLVLAISGSFMMNAQTADEIINTYFENIGGLENLKKVEGIKMSAKISQQGMEIPLEIVQIKGGKQMTVITFQGKEIKQGVFDGEILWSTNFSNMKAEKNDAEATANMKLESNDFPDPFFPFPAKRSAFSMQ